MFLRGVTMTKKQTVELIQTILKNDDSISNEAVEKIQLALTGKPEPVKQQYFNLKELCAIYGISRGTGYQLIKKGIIKPIVLNGVKNGLTRYLPIPLEDLQQKKEG